MEDEAPDPERPRRLAMPETPSQKRRARNAYRTARGARGACREKHDRRLIGERKLSWVSSQSCKRTSVSLGCAGAAPGQEGEKIVASSGRKAEPMTRKSKMERMDEGG